MANGNKEQIRQYMLKLIDAGDQNVVAKTVENFGISKSTVYNYLKKLCEKGILRKTSGAKCPYQLISEQFVYPSHVLGQRYLVGCRAWRPPCI